MQPVKQQPSNLFVYRGGKPSALPNRPTLLFIHGAQNDHSVWILQSRYFAHHGYNVLAVDLPGHGRSLGEPLPTVEAMAQALLPMIQQELSYSLSLSDSTTSDSTTSDSATSNSTASARSEQDLIVIGHSMGSLIALELTQWVPVKAIALLGTAVPMKVSSQLLEATQTNEGKAIAQINQWSHSQISPYPGNPGPGFSIYVQNLRLMQRQAKGVLFADFNACNAYANGQERLAAWRGPSLVLQGQQDFMTPYKSALAVQGSLAQHNADEARLVGLPDCGHALMSEKPEQVLLALKQFMSQVSP
jgi:pimeloyl-ACP methyl ester carboxylesterase